MKKIILIIILILSLSGCYDYKEVNNMAFVSAVGIDYKDDEFKITIELLNDKTDKDSMQITTYTTEGSDKSLAIAIEEASDEIVKEVNYSHIKLLIISESVAKEKLESLFDFFLRSTYFRENFYIITSLDDDPGNILKTTTKENPIASDAIIKLLENNDYTSNSAILKTFDSVVNEIITEGIDTCFSNIKIEEDNFIIDGMSIFKDSSFKNKLSNDDATLYNILTSNFYRPIFSKDYDDKYFSVAIATGKVKFELDKQKINISGNLTGKIMDNDPRFKIRDLKTLNKLNDDFSELLNKKLEDFFKTLQENESDILGISKSYFQKTRKKNNELWKNAQIDTNIKFNINKKGLIYEVKDEK